MDFEKTCMLFTMEEPFYGILLSSMERVPRPSVKTLGVGRSGNVFKLFYNPAFIEKQDVDTTLALLKHEVLHVAFNHFSLWDDDHPSHEIHELRNIALDMEVNGYLDISKFHNLHPVLASDVGWENFLGGREYFNRLMQMSQQMQQKSQAKQPQQPCNGGQGGQQPQQQPQQQGQQQQQQQQSNQPQQQNPQQQEQGQGQGNESEEQSQDSQQNQQGSGYSRQPEVAQELLDQYQTFDDHSMWPTCDNEQEMQDLQQVIDTMLDFAAEEVEKARGTIPGEIAGRIEKIRKKPKPVADWKRYFRRYLGNEFTEFIRKSKKRESRRFPDAAGNRHRRKSHILVAIDTSGSVSAPEYREFFGQIRTLTQHADFHVVECDACIQYEYDYRNRPTKFEELHGGGGTDFQPVIDLYNESKRKYDALVYFTDGYCDIPKDTPKDTLWVISSGGDHNRKKYKVNGASVAIIPKKQ